MKVQRIFTYPVKGLSGSELSAVEVRAALGIPGDRMFAFLFEDSREGVPDPRRLEWVNKSHFAVQNDWPGLAALRCELDRDRRMLVIRGKAKEPLETGDSFLIAESFDEDAGRQRLGEFVTNYLKALAPSSVARHPVPSSVRLVGHPEAGTRYPDRANAHLSILSLASLRALESALGRNTDIRRFRGNVIIDGSIEAWDELRWEAGRKFRLGTSEVSIKAPITRCANIDVDPDDGGVDVPVLKGLKDHFGHMKFGVMAVIEKAGGFRVGDALEPF